ncbi:MAG: acylneuraminate cytidylyltransferase family protein [Crocinitomicaceae bacterium]|nr:acylneuraminate cytidylyltransferase family protein [Crocinitomicaceae bacterium]
MKVIALLPMKGNSERVPGKNIRDFNGKPLFFHVLGTLTASNYIDQIIINTDSDQFAEMALAHSSKVKIHKRPQEICGDFVSMNDVINYDIDNSDGMHYLQTHSTNPLLRVSTIDNAIEAYENLPSHFDSLFSVTRHQTRLFWEDGSPINHNPQELIRTQDLPPVFEENSNFFIFSRESFKKAGNKRIGLHPKMFEVNKIEAVDIDDENDFLIAEALQKLNILQSIDK